ncbi:MAG: hypothetical protein LBI03_00520 [Clostridiales bacterium]|nr:hypothetical protein [Clostridiales bacterium]
MSEEKRNLKREDYIIEHLDGELKETALKFADYLNENQITLKPDGSPDGKIPYKEYYLCEIRIEPNKLEFHFWFGDYSGEFDEGFTSAVQKHIRFCRACHSPCTGGMDTIIFGKEFENVCSQHTVVFENPDEKELQYIKTLIEYAKKIVPDSVSYHAHNL